MDGLGGNEFAYYNYACAGFGPVQHALPTEGCPIRNLDHYQSDQGCAQTMADHRLRCRTLENPTTQKLL
jgi:hypothetical protein